MKKIILLVISVSFLFPIGLYAQEKIVFTGIPEVKISEAATSRIPETLSGKKAIEYKCTITKIDDRYYWTTRKNIELIAIEFGAYITFVASNGSGYVRIIAPEMKEIVAAIDEVGGKYDYIEHLLLGLRTISYYGKSK